MVVKREAENAKNQTVAELVNRTYAVNGSVLVKELLEFWLEADVRKNAGSSNTYDTYKNIAVKHIIPNLGGKRLQR